ncbi:phosphonate metabolism transcriptional regulator PhnF [Celeribacter sp.]|uniref:phosphonate metabolism transcriptional regulator PhnF n=1 Tax=Celeribacter sp. TaxID=1890673 RepID=UPI003A93470E
MARSPIWKTIAATLAREIAQGLYAEGDKLPTEAALAQRFGVNRHTVRRAVADLVEQGAVRTRRGAGVFVTQSPADYPIGKRTRFHQNIVATGRLAHKRPLRVETRPASVQEAEALDLEAGASVTVYEGVSMSGASPLAHFVSVFPTGRLGGVGIEAALAQTSSVTEALRLCDIPDYLRRDTRITAELADAVTAVHLGLREGDPVLCAVAVNTDPEGVPVEYGTTRFAGNKVALTVAPD